MKRRTFLSDDRPLQTGLLLCLVGVLSAATLNAADLRESKTSTGARTSKTETPLFVLNCAGAARILDDLDTVCRSVKRGKLALAVRAVLALSGDLKGIDRTRPFGLMTFINPGEVPEPVAVAYVPITSFDDLRQTLQKIAQVTLSAGQDRDGTYTLETPVGTFRLVRRGKYIFIARQSLSLKRHFGDPAQRFATLTRRHDLAVEFRLSAVPTGMKTMILDYLRAGVDSKLRNLRDESVQQRRFRREATMAAVSLFERILLDGEQMTFGWNLSKQRIRAELELQLVARPGTRLALQLKQRSAILHFAPPSDNAPLTLSAVWRFGQTEFRLLASGLDILDSKTKRKTADGKTLPKLNRTLLMGLVAAGREARLQLRLLGNSPGHLVLAADFVVNAEKYAVPKAVRELVTWFKRQALIQGVKIAGSVPGLGMLIKFQCTDIGPEWKRILGDTPSVILFTRTHAVRLMAGGAADIQKFQKQQARQKRVAKVTENRGEILRLTAKLSHWLPMLLRETKLQPLSKLTKRAFADGQDGVRLIVKTGERSLTVNVEFDAGVVRLVVLALIQRFEGK